MLISNADANGLCATLGNLFSLNGTNYDGSQLPPKGQQISALLTEAQDELARLKTRKALLQAAQQQLISSPSRATAATKRSAWAH